MKVNKKRRWLAIVISLCLWSCSDSDQPLSNVASQKEALAPDLPRTIATSPGEIEGEAKKSTSLSPDYAQHSSVSETDTISTSKLPTGRLSSIVVSDLIKHAVIKSNDKMVRLIEGQQWDGWQVTHIRTTAVVFTRDGHEARMELQTTAAPVAVNVAERLGMLPVSSSEETTQANKPSLILSEKQKQRLRTNLLVSD